MTVGPCGWDVLSLQPGVMKFHAGGRLAHLLLRFGRGVAKVRPDAPQDVADAGQQLLLLIGRQVGHGLGATQAGQQLKDCGVGLGRGAHWCPPGRCE